MPSRAPRASSGGGGGMTDAQVSAFFDGLAARYQESQAERRERQARVAALLADAFDPEPGFDVVEEDEDDEE